MEPLEIIRSIGYNIDVAWQRYGNQKSNSPYLMDNTDNVNPTSDKT